MAVAKPWPTATMPHHDPTAPPATRAPVRVPRRTTDPGSPPYPPTATTVRPASAATATRPAPGTARATARAEAAMAATVTAATAGPATGDTTAPVVPSRPSSAAAT